MDTIYIIIESFVAHYKDTMKTKRVWNNAYFGTEPIELVEALRSENPANEFSIIGLQNDATRFASSSHGDEQNPSDS